MKLIDLEPEYVTYEQRIEEYTVIVGDPMTWKTGDPTRKLRGPREYRRAARTFEDAHGITFLCPKCFTDNLGPVGTHGINLTFSNRKVPAGLGSRNSGGGDSRWRVSGTCLDDLSVETSVLLVDHCGAHFYIRNGGIEFV